MSLSQSPPSSAPYPKSSLYPGPALSTKSNFIFQETAKSLFRKQSVEKVLFVTLTFPKKITHPEEAGDRLKSLLNQIRSRYGNYIWVMHTHASGAIHYHLLLPITFDAHKDTDLSVWRFREEYSDRQRIKAMNPSLRAESDWFTSKAKAYGFGRIEVAPVYSDGTAVALYLANTNWRLEAVGKRQRVRFWGSSRGLKAGTVKFSWNSPRARDRRKALGIWATEQGCFDYSDLSRVIGRYWGWLFHLFLKALDEAGKPWPGQPPRREILSTRAPFTLPHPAVSSLLKNNPPKEVAAERTAPEVSGRRCDIMSVGRAEAI